MTMFGDATPDDSFDPTVELDPHAVGRILAALLIRLRDVEGHSGETLVALAVLRLVARLKREGVLL